MGGKKRFKPKKYDHTCPKPDEERAPGPYDECPGCGAGLRWCECTLGF